MKKAAGILLLVLLVAAFALPGLSLIHISEPTRQEAIAFCGVGV